MSRILTFHEKDVIGGGSRIGAAYYMEADYSPVAVRIEAEKAPSDGELEVDIYDDGVSIFTNTAAVFSAAPTTKGPTLTSNPSKTTVSLTVGQTHEELVANFKSGNIAEGSWITCKIFENRGASNITVQLELEEIE